MTDDETRVPSEGDRELREQLQETNELAKELRPPHDPDAERGTPAPVEPRTDG
jgi:hypothetical protein